ncbi:MAG: PAS domain-containing protein, partial [Planctomycetota bacterium]
MAASTSKKVVNSDRFGLFTGDEEKATGAFTRLKAVVDNLGTNVLISNSDLELVYMNQRSEDTLRAIEAVIQKELGLSVDELLGSSLDQFHNVRAKEIRKTLSNPKNLPIKTDIRLGALSLALEVNPVYDDNGDYAGQVVNWEDVTEKRRLEARNLDYTGQLTAIRNNQAVIEFQMDGTVLAANDHFCNALGYRLEEIKGQHHRIFCDSTYTGSSEYKEFWAKLNRGEYVAGEFKRIRKDGKDIWIQASYNPIPDEKGKPFKVVKFAIDITADVMGRLDMAKKEAMVTNAPINIM